MSFSLEQVLSTCWSGAVQWNCSMAKYSTLRAGGSAKALVVPKSREELGRLIHGLAEHKIDWVVIGRGSNVLFTDAGFGGVVIVLGPDLGKITVVQKNSLLVEVDVEAGCGLPRFVSWCVEHGYAGLEFAGAIPGSVGGATKMNAGAWGDELGNHIIAVTVLDHAGKYAKVAKKDLRFGYRNLKLPEKGIVISTCFRLKQGKREDMAALLKEYRNRRVANQPQGVASAGSFFKNPEAGPAGKFIDDAGLKGMQVGGAKVSEKHANFLVNTGNASATDIVNLMHEVQSRVYEMFHVRLLPEVRIIGRQQDKEVR